MNKIKKYTIHILLISTLNVWGKSIDHHYQNLYLDHAKIQCYQLATALKDDITNIDTFNRIVNPEIILNNIITTVANKEIITNHVLGKLIEFIEYSAHKSIINCINESHPTLDSTQKNDLTKRFVISMRNNAITAINKNNSSNTAIAIAVKPFIGKNLDVRAKKFLHDNKLSQSTKQSSYYCLQCHKDQKSSHSMVHLSCGDVICTSCAKKYFFGNHTITTCYLCGNTINKAILADILYED